MKRKSTLFVATLFLASSALIGCNVASKPKVTFMNGNDVFKTVEVEKDKPVAEPAEKPTKAEAQESDGKYYTYSFDKWLKDGAAYDFATPVTADLKLDASYLKEVVKQKVKFTVDGAKVSEVSVDKGGLVTRPNDPVKPDGQGQDGKYYSYTFNKWLNGTKEWKFGEDKVMSDIELVADFNATVITKTVKFTVDGEQYGEIATVNKGGKVVKPADPVKQECQEEGKYYSFTFDKWMNGEAEYDFDAPVMEDIVLTAKFNKTKVTKQVKFISNGEQYGNILTVDKGAKVTAPETDPTKPEGSEEGLYYTYTFDKWMNGQEAYDFNAAVMDNLELTAKFNHAAVMKTVTFKVDGVQYGEIADVQKGAKVSAPAVAPTKDEAQEGDGKYYAYTFKEWQLGGVAYNFDNAVLDNLELTAAFDKTVVTKTVKFINEGEQYGEIVTVNKGAKVTAPATNPTKASSISTVYTFKEWQKDGVAYSFDTVVMDNIELVAAYEESTRQYHAKFLNYDGSVLSEGDFDYNTTPAPVGDAKIPNTAHKLYAFDGWDKDVDPISSDTVYTPKFKENGFAADVVVPLGSQFNDTPIANASMVGDATWELEYSSVDVNGYLKGGVALVSDAGDKLKAFVSAGEDKLFFMYNGWKTIGTYSVPNASTGFSLQLRFVKANGGITLYADGTSVGTAPLSDSDPYFGSNFGGTHVIELAPVRELYRDDCSIKIANVDVYSTRYSSAGAALNTSIFNNSYRVGDWIWDIDAYINTTGVGQLAVSLGTEASAFDSRACLALSNAENKVFYSLGNWSARGNVDVTYTAGNTIHLQFVKHGLSIDGYVNGTKVGTINYSDDDHAHSLFGEAPLCLKLERIVYNENPTYYISNHCMPYMDQYSVTFTSDGAQYGDVAKVNKGGLVTKPANPTKPDAKKGDKWYSYSFDKWLLDGEEFDFNTQITEDIELVASFIETEQKVRVTFMNDGAQYGEIVELDKGAKVTAPATNPTKEMTASTIYTFKEWQKDGVAYDFDQAVNEDITLTAAYTETTRKYTVKYLDYDGTELQNQEIEYNTTPTAPTSPTRAADGDNTYAFSSWDREAEAVKGNQTYYANYSATPSNVSTNWESYTEQAMSNSALDGVGSWAVNIEAGHCYGSDVGFKLTPEGSDEKIVVSFEGWNNILHFQYYDGATWWGFSNTTVIGTFKESGFKVRILVVRGASGYSCYAANIKDQAVEGTLPKDITSANYTLIGSFPANIGGTDVKLSDVWFGNNSVSMKTHAVTTAMPEVGGFTYSDINVSKGVQSNGDVALNNKLANTTLLGDGTIVASECPMAAMYSYYTGFALRTETGSTVAFFLNSMSGGWQVKVNGWYTAATGSISDIEKDVMVRAKVVKADGVISLYLNDTKIFEFNKDFGAYGNNLGGAYFEEGAIVYLSAYNEAGPGGTAVWCDARAIQKAAY